MTWGQDNVTFRCTPGAVEKGRKEPKSYPMAGEGGWGTRYWDVNSDKDLTKDPCGGGLREASGCPG